MELIEEIRKNLNEELGISDAVTQKTNELLSAIIADKKEKPLIGNKKRGVIKNFDLFGVPTRVEYVVYFVKTRKEMLDLRLFRSGFFNEGRKRLNTTIVYVKNENRYYDYDGTAQHEIEHAYQTKLSGQSLLRPKNIGMYLKADKLQKENDAISQIVGYTVYYANKFEVDGKINGLYRLIKENWEDDPMEIIKTTALYYNLKVIKEHAEKGDWMFKMGIEKVCMDNFGKHYKWWKNMALSTTSFYARKIGKMLAKIQKEREEELSDPNGRITPLNV